MSSDGWGLDGRTAGRLAFVTGGLVIVLPFVYFGGPGSLDDGPVRFAVLVMESILVGVGVGIIATGRYSQRTGDPGPAIWAVATLCNLAVLGAISAAVEMSGGPLVPIPVWFVAALLAIGVAVWMTNRILDRQRTTT